MQCKYQSRVIPDTGTYVVHELLAHRADLLAQCGTEHHHLLLVRRHLEDFLHVIPHVWWEVDQSVGEGQHVASIGKSTQDSESLLP